MNMRQETIINKTLYSTKTKDYKTENKLDRKKRKVKRGIEYLLNGHDQHTQK